MRDVRDVIVGEFDAPEGAVRAAEVARELGYETVDAFTPFSVPELDAALGLRRPKVPLAALVAGVTGTAVALLVQWWCNAIDYPLDVGGRPYASWPTYVIIMFETTVLLAACTTFAAVLFASRLPRLHDDAFDFPGFQRTTIDRFWIAVGDTGREPDRVASERAKAFREALRVAGAIAVHDVRAR